MKVENSRGITLIALVVTIIVLVLIAGISISALTSDNGVLRQTNLAKVEQIEANAREQVKLAVSAMKLAILEASARDNSYNASKNTVKIQEKLVETLNFDKSGLNGTFKAESVSGAELKLSYTGDDYQNACNNKNAQIVYTIVLGQKIIEVTDEANETLKSSDNINVGLAVDSNPGALEGNGTQVSPYVINSIEDLVFFSYDVGQGNNYEGKYVKLGTDLDFTNTESYVQSNRTDYGTYGYEGELKTLLTSGVGFIPIGKTYDNDAAGDAYFAGTFDGNGKIISNLRINTGKTITTDVGLFTSNRGVIKNLGVEKCNINLNCSEKPYDWTACGVICGVNQGKIDSCWTSGNIEANWTATTHLEIGGIAGVGNQKSNSDAVISNCYNRTNINALQNTSATNGRHLYVGGIVASAENMLIINCYNVGNIKGELITTNTARMIAVGGISGIGGIPSKCYNLGNIEGKQSAANPRVGGIIGHWSSSTKTIEYCCNIGNVAYTGKDTSAKYVGTLIGSGTNIVSNSSYTLNNATLSGIGSSGTISGLIYKNTKAEMPTVLEIVGSAFKADTNINDGYPILSWQN